MSLIEISCSFCNKKFFREARQFNEANKLKRKQYCSPKCLSLDRNKQETLKCGNPRCHKSFKRTVSEIPLPRICFCSNSCSAIVNNSRSPKRRPKIRICPFCGKQFTGDRKYCSRQCQPKPQKIPKKQIIKEIKEFYKSNGRIPLKRESHHYKATRLRFGTWNKAIKAAGFKPHQVLFAKKYIANDGHKCDSLAEKIIDDWLTARKIPHQKNVFYPNSKYTTDFKVRGTFIEFFGLQGELRIYDQYMRKKLRLIRNNNLSLISIYPKDLFPKSKLDYVLKDLIK